MKFSEETKKELWDMIDEMSNDMSHFVIGLCELV